jgi:hypothetical protein
VTFVPANLRRNAGFNFPETQSFPRARLAGIAGLTPRDQRRLCDGVQHAVACGPRWIGELLLQVARDGLDQEEILAVLDNGRLWSPEVVLAFGGDGFPPMALNEVPR